MLQNKTGAPVGMAHWLKRSNSSLATYNIWHQATMSLNLMSQAKRTFENLNKDYNF